MLQAVQDNSGYSYHSLLGKSLDLLDSTGSALLEGDTVQLFKSSAFLSYI